MTLMFSIMDFETFIIVKNILTMVALKFVF